MDQMKAIILNVLKKDNIIKQIRKITNKEIELHFSPFIAIKTTYAEMHNIIFNSVVEREETEELADKVVLESIQSILNDMPNKDALPIGTHAAISKETANDMFTYAMNLIGLTITAATLQSAIEVEK